MSREHTPGPWIISSVPTGPGTRDEVTVVDAGRRLIARLALNFTLDEANARLIAAAPDLLGTLANLVERLQQSGLDKTPPGGVGPFAHEGVEYSVIRDARAAIEKATGEQP